VGACEACAESREVALDERLVDLTPFKLAYQPHRALAQEPAHLNEVGLSHLPHRAIELELLEGPQREPLVALERARARPCTVGPRSGPSPASGASRRSAAIPTSPAAATLKITRPIAAGGRPRSSTTAAIDVTSPANEKEGDPGAGP
jgi:hypothetical protein